VVDPPGWGACAGFAGTCGESGEQTGIRTVCRDGRSRDEVVRRACRREREGVTCERWGTCRDEQCVDERDSYSADGCRGGAYDWSCNRHCERCRLQDGFLCYNQDGCGGLTCCLRYAGAGLDGMVVLYTRLRQTAYGRWLFDEPLAGTYRVIADVPSIQGLPVPNGCGRWNLARAVRHNLKVGDETVATTVRDHGVDTGRSVVLFEGDLTGVTGVTVGNAWDGAGGECGHILLDRIRAEPYL